MSWNPETGAGIARFAKIEIRVPGRVWDDYLDPNCSTMQVELGLDAVPQRWRKVGKGSQLIYSDVPLDIARELADYLNDRGRSLLGDEEPETRGVHRRAMLLAAAIRAQIKETTQ